MRRRGMPLPGIMRLGGPRELGGGYAKEGPPLNDRVEQGLIEGEHDRALEDIYRGNEGKGPVPETTEPERGNEIGSSGPFGAAIDLANAYVRGSTRIAGGMAKGAFETIKKFMETGTPESAAKVATMFVGGGAPGAARGAVGAAGGKPPRVPTLNTREKAYFDQLVADKLPADEIARVMTSYYTPPGVRVTPEQVKEMLRMEGSAAGRGWSPEINRRLESLVSENVVVKKGRATADIPAIQAKLQKEFPGADTGASSLEYRIRKLQNRDLGLMIDSMVNDLRKAAKELASGDRT